MRVKIPDLHLQARTLKPSYPGEPEMSRMHVNSGESGVEILKLKCMRLRPSHFSCGVTGERSRRGQAHRGGAAWSVDGGMTAVLRKSWEFYQHKILIALVFFVLKFAWFLIKDSNLSL